MEAKKNPRYDVARYRGIIFGASFMLSLALTIIAFEWTTRLIPRTMPTFEEPTHDWLMDAPLITIPQPSVAAKMPSASKVVVAIPAEVIETEMPAETEPIFIDSLFLPSVLPDPPAEVTPDVPLIFAEVMPSPEGGLKKFYEVIAKNIRYPKAAIAAHMEGKVFVQFTVRADGTPGDWKILKGVGFGCDEEAIRVLALTKWAPGRQGGRKVPVRMVQPIVFKIP
jgi:protein TonB